MRSSVTRLALLCTVAPFATAQSTLYIEACSLGCSSGAGGVPVSCASVIQAPNGDLRVRFSRPVDPASVAAPTFQIVDVNSGQVPAGTRSVDANDSRWVVFRPSLSFDAFGNPVFGLNSGTTYRITIPGLAQGDAPPFVMSTDVPALANTSRLQCDIQVQAQPAWVGANDCPGTSACPCANAGTGGNGCGNSVSSAGVGLFAQGQQLVSQDRLELLLTGLPSGTVQFFQGTLRENGGAGTVFGDGLLCVGGDYVRLRSRSGATGLRVVPASGQPLLSLQGSVPPAGGTRRYQALYRDDASFCTPAVVNGSNAVEVLWLP